MPDDEESLVGPNGMPLPPPPPGLNFPPPPPIPVPPPPPVEANEIPQSVNDPEIENPPDEEPKNDFQSHWEKRKSDSDSQTIESRDSMYGHIDRISSGQVGSLMDRFSDRFGSELDREIIVLRKKQQQDLLAIKPTVELISSPDDDYEEESEGQINDIEEDSAGLFPQFFEIVNNLLGDMDEDFINSFVSSDDFPLFQEVGEDPSHCDDETKAEFFSMINRVLGELPEEKIGDFVASPGFAIYQEMGEIYS
tara:strand:+ start:70 stop:822 length:753 start_codon:yes stop_codon:yes gene_type:complete